MRLAFNFFRWLQFIKYPQRKNKQKFKRNTMVEGVEKFRNDKQNTT